MPIAPSVKLGQNVSIPQPDLVNLYGCEIGDDSKIGAFVEIQKGVKVGRFCKVSSHSFLCEGVTLEDKVFVGHGVLFTNDPYPRSATGDKLQTEADWKVVPTLVKEGASLGSGSVILCGLTIGKGALVGAGAVVTKDVPDFTIVTGVPAKVTGNVRHPEGKA
jgi:acetyltransferase-like isoleucine patch superfamily enzyme